MPMHTVIIGGTAGIGLATAQRLTADGHAVTVVGRDGERLKRALDQIGGDRATGRLADLADRAQLDSLFAATGPVDHLVVTAPGTGSVGALADLDLGDLAAAFDTKFLSYARAIQAALPHLAKTGSITLTSAVSARCAMPGVTGLAAVNGAVETIVPALALELSPIRVNAVSPGVIDTDWWDRIGAPREAVFAGLATSIPAGRVGRAEEVADAIALLVRNGYITGIVLPVDGGSSLKP